MYDEVKTYQTDGYYTIWGRCDVNGSVIVIRKYDVLEYAMEDFIGLHEFAAQWGHDVWLASNDGPMVVRHANPASPQFSLRCERYQRVASFM